MKKLIFILGFTCLLSSGCLKDKPLTDYTNIAPIIINPTANWPRIEQLSVIAFSQTGGNKELQLYARISWQSLFDHELIVTFVNDQSAIDEYNSTFNTNYVAMPQEGYFVNMQLVIPAREQEAFVPITIKPSQVSVAPNYMLAFTISNAQGEKIASNYKTYLIPIEVQ